MTPGQIPAGASVGGPADQPSTVFGWLADRADPQLIFHQLGEVIDPELGVNERLAWQWGGGLNAVALLAFVGLAASAVIRPCRREVAP